MSAKVAAKMAAKMAAKTRNNVHNTAVKISKKKQAHTQLQRILDGT